MPSLPLVSIIMVTYNHEPYIAQAIEGVINQRTNFPFELVIGEDCSKDNTYQIVSEYQRKFPDIIRVITSESNVGGHNNSMRVTRLCLGKYVAYCDGDDYWNAPHKLQMQVDFLEASPDYSLVYNNFDVLDEVSEKYLNSAITGTNNLNDSDAYADIITRQRRIPSLTVCTRRDTVLDIINNNGEWLNPKYLVGDLQLWLEISRYGKVKYLSDVVATYRSHAASVSNSHDPQKALALELSVQSLIDHYLIKYPSSNDVIQKAKYWHALKVLIAAVYAGNKKTAKDQRRKLRQLGLFGKLCVSDLVIYFGSYIRSNNLAARITMKLSQLFKFSE